MDSKFHAAACAALQSFPVKGHKVTFVSHSENISFRVEARPGKSYVLRLHRPTYHSHDELVSEQLWTEALIEAGLDVPVAVRTKTGQRYATVECPDGERFAGLLEWVEGEELGNVSLGDGKSASTIDSYRRLGRLVAQLHNQAVNWSIPIGFSRHALDTDGFVGDEPFWGRFWESNQLDATQQNELSSIRQAVSEILSAYERTPFNFSLIHADLHPHNVIVQGTRLHIIDFDDSGFGWHAYDLAVALHQMKDDAGYVEAKSSLLEGYTEIRSIGQREIDMIEVFHAVRSLASIGWATSRPELHPNTRSLCQYIYKEAITDFAKVSA